MNEEIVELIKKLRPNMDVTKNMNLKDDLYFDSMDIISFLFDVEREIGIKISEQDIDRCHLLKIENLIKYANSQQQKI